MPAEVGVAGVQNAPEGEAPSEPGLARRSRLRRSFTCRDSLSQRGRLISIRQTGKPPSHSGTPELRQLLTSSLAFFVEVPDPLVDVGVNGMIRLGKITGRKEGPPNMLHVVVADGVRENREQIIDPEP
jgi:hypothetical protein